MYDKQLLGLNVYNYRGVELPYADKDEIPDWAFMQVQAMYSLGIMTRSAGWGQGFLLAFI